MSAFSEEDVAFLTSEMNKHFEDVEIDMKSRKKYSIYNYTYEFEYRIDMLSCPFRYRMVVKTYEYSAVCKFINIGGSNILFTKEFPSIEEDDLFKFCPICRKCIYE